MVRETSEYRCSAPPTAGCPTFTRLMDDILIGCHLFDTASARQAFLALFGCDRSDGCGNKSDAGTKTSG